MSRKIEMNISYPHFSALGQMAGDTELLKTIGYLCTWGIALDGERDATVQVSSSAGFGGGPPELSSAITQGTNTFVLMAIFDVRDGKFGFHS